MLTAWFKLLLRFTHFEISTKFRISLEVTVLLEWLKTWRKHADFLCFQENEGGKIINGMEANFMGVFFFFSFPPVANFFKSLFSNGSNEFKIGLFLLLFLK